MVVNVDDVQVQVDSTLHSTFQPTHVVWPSKCWEDPGSSVWSLVVWGPGDTGGIQVCDKNDLALVYLSKP